MRPNHEENVMPTYTQMRDLFQKYHDPRDMVAGHLYRSPQEQAHMTFGIVEDNKDPDELGRIKVWMPMLAPDAKAWMPVVKPFTGIWMMPEIEDEVLVGFIANDPLAPVCLGGYYNPRTAPPIQKNPDNNLKVFTSRSGMRVEINDTDGEERITAFALEGKMRLVVTPEGISAVNEEGDVTLSCKTFTVEETEAISIAAEKKMSLECKDPFTLESGGATEIKASGDVKNNGKKIKVKGSTGVTSGGKQLAKKDDQVVGVDMHDIMVPSPSGPVKVPMIPHPYMGKLADKLSDDVTINDKPAAVKGSKSKHNPPGHICMPPGVMFASPPSGEGEVSSGTAAKCKINDKEAACLGSMVKTCNDPQDQETCTIIAVGMAVKLPIMMPGMDPAQFEQDGGTTFNSNDPGGYNRRICSSPESSN
jgi:type VI secretion system secreted protein VgrG